MTNEDAGESIWIEPRIVVLDVEETHLNPGVGRDGGIADCSKS